MSLKSETDNRIISPEDKENSVIRKAKNNADDDLQLPSVTSSHFFRPLRNSPDGIFSEPSLSVICLERPRNPTPPVTEEMSVQECYSSSSLSSTDIREVTQYNEDDEHSDSCHDDNVSRKTFVVRSGKDSRLDLPMIGSKYNLYSNRDASTPYRSTSLRNTLHSGSPRPFTPVPRLSAASPVCSRSRLVTGRLINNSSPLNQTNQMRGNISCFWNKPVVSYRHNLASKNDNANRSSDPCSPRQCSTGSEDLFCDSSSQRWCGGSDLEVTELVSTTTQDSKKQHESSLRKLKMPSIVNHYLAVGNSKCAWQARVSRARSKLPPSDLPPSFSLVDELQDNNLFTQKCTPESLECAPIIEEDLCKHGRDSDECTFCNRPIARCGREFKKVQDNIEERRKNRKKRLHKFIKSTSS